MQSTTKRLFSASLTILKMNRPRNRQPRTPRGDSNNSRGGGRGGNRSSKPRPPRTWTPGTPQQASGTVPTTREVVPGASVFIILKEDQASGRETAGIVQELLTRGDHPRGIKVRLRGGMVGRVQRIGTGEAAEGQRSQDGGAIQNQGGSGGRIQHKYRDVRLEEDEEPPERSLAEYLPAGFDEPAARPRPQKVTATVKCPFCDEFEGDEVAVSHHVEKHLT